MKLTLTTSVLVLALMAGVREHQPGESRFLLDARSSTALNANESGGEYPHESASHLDPADASSTSHPLQPEAERPCELAGLVVAARVAIAAPVSGVVGRLPLLEGDIIESGRPLLLIDSSEERMQQLQQAERVRAAAAEVEEARVQLERAVYERDLNRRLAARRVVTAQALRLSEFDVDAQRSRLSAVETRAASEAFALRAIEARLAKHEILAPFRGRVLEVVRWPGTFAEQGDIVLHFEALEERITAELPGKDVPELAQLVFDVRSAGSELEWVCSPRVRTRPGYNDDGSKTLLLEIPDGAMLEPGQIVSIRATRRPDPPAQ